jgi:hypothetical protein
VRGGGRVLAQQPYPLVVDLLVVPGRLRQEPLQPLDLTVLGPLESGEIEAQWRSIALLDKAGPPDLQAIEAVRRLSTVRAAELANVMSQFEARWTEEEGRR